MPLTLPCMYTQNLHVVYYFNIILEVHRGYYGMHLCVCGVLCVWLKDILF